MNDLVNMQLQAIRHTTSDNLTQIFSVILYFIYLATCPISRNTILNEPVYEISNIVVCATSKASDQPAHTRSLIRAFARRLSIL